MSNEKIFIAIDGNAIVHRAYHAYPLTLTTSSGEPVNAVYGFAVMLLEILKRFNPEYIICCFDTGKPTFRHAKFTDYKAHRKAVEPSLILQFPLVEELVKAFNIPIVRVDGFEADDSLGTLAAKVKDGKWSGQDLKMIIVSGDRDLLQLVSDNVNVCLPQGNFKSLTVFNRASTKERYGYFPEQVIDFKAIVGDPSDNIPGVKGMGEKSVTEMLEKYGSMNEIYKHLADLKPRQALLLKEGIEQAEFSRDLATISTDVPMDVTLEQCVMRDFSRQAIIDEFMKFEFRSLIDRIPASSVEEQNIAISQQKSGGSQLDMFGEPIETNTKFKIPNEGFVGSEEGVSLDDVFGVKESAKFKKLSVEELQNEIQNADKIKEKMNMYFVFIEADESIDGQEYLLVIMEDNGSEKYNYTSIEMKPEALEKLIALVRAVDSNKCDTFFFNYEEFVSRIPQNLVIVTTDELDKFAPKKFIELRILANLISSATRSFTISALAFDYLFKNIPAKLSRSDASLVAETVIDLKIKLLEKAEKSEFSPFIKMNVRKVIEKYDKKEILDIENHFDNLLLDFSVIYESKIAQILAVIEKRGIQVDVELLKTLKGELEIKIARLEKEVFDFVGHEFNLNSPKQLSGILYDSLHLPKIGRGKKALSTDEDTLTELQAYSEVIAPILESRGLKKLLGTYVEAFLEIVEEKIPNSKFQIPKDDTLDLQSSDVIASAPKLPIIHTDYKINVASSGRLSSQNPNLQNLPVKGEYANRFREVFVPRNGFKFVSIDYSQIELRMMAEISQDKDLISIFKEGADIHRATAAKIFNITEAEVTKEQRQAAKTVVFGVLYGQTSFGLSKQLGLSREDATTYISEYFNKYQGVAAYIEDATQKAQRLGYVESMFGRKRYVTGLNSENRMIRAAATREAVNMPLQGSAADLMKMAMIVVDGIIKRDFKGKAFILLQVHDELIFEVMPEIMEDFEKKVCKVMSEVVDFSVPLEVHFSQGDNLSELK